MIYRRKSRDGRLKQSELEGKLHVIGAVREAQLVVDALLVGVHRLGADRELLANFWRGIAFSDEAHHGALAVGETFVARTIGGLLLAASRTSREYAGGGRLHPFFAARNRAHGFHELAIRGALHEVAGSSLLHPSPEIALPSFHR